MADLHIPMKWEFFDQIASGEKTEEYRLTSTYWRRRIEGRDFERIVLSGGYPTISRKLSRHYTFPGFPLKMMTTAIGPGLRPAARHAEHTARARISPMVMLKSKASTASSRLIEAC